MQATIVTDATRTVIAVVDGNVCAPVRDRVFVGGHLDLDGVEHRLEAGKPDHGLPGVTARSD